MAHHGAAARHSSTPCTEGHDAQCSAPCTCSAAFSSGLVFTPCLLPVYRCPAHACPVLMQGPRPPSLRRLHGLHPGPE